MAELLDSEFGSIKLNRRRLARGVSLKLNSAGQISASLSLHAPLFLIKQLIDQSRPALRLALSKLNTQQNPIYDGQQIGRFHKLEFVDAEIYKSRLLQNKLLIYRPAQFEPPILEKTIKDGVEKTLKKQAAFYLPKRLSAMANEFGFEYQKVGFSSAQTRWGSCSSVGAIKLNIWLMILPDELIDYVIAHELCHTKHLNHSANFWQAVGGIYPNHKRLRMALKDYQPGKI